MCARSKYKPSWRHSSSTVVNWAKSPSSIRSSAVGRPKSPKSSKGWDDGMSPGGLRISWSTRAFTLLISSERLSFIPLSAARTMVSSEAGSQGGVKAGGPIGVVDVGWEGGVGDMDRRKVGAFGVGTSGGDAVRTGRAGDFGDSSSVDIGVSESASLLRSRMQDLLEPLPFDLVREEIGEGFGSLAKRIAEVRSHAWASFSASKILTFES
jgi:hypothetical protein